jgi:hypothetical protein
MSDIQSIRTGLCIDKLANISINGKHQLGKSALDQVINPSGYNMDDVLGFSSSPACFS